MTRWDLYRAAQPGEENNGEIPGGILYQDFFPLLAESLCFSQADEALSGADGSTTLPSECALLARGCYLAWANLDDTAEQLWRKQRKLHADRDSESELRRVGAAAGTTIQASNIYMHRA